LAQFFPLDIEKTPSVVPAYRVVGVIGSIARVFTLRLVSPLLYEVQVAPLLVLW